MNVTEYGWMKEDRGKGFIKGGEQERGKRLDDILDRHHGLDASKTKPYRPAAHPLLSLRLIHQLVRIRLDAVPLRPPRRACRRRVLRPVSADI